MLIFSDLGLGGVQTKIIDIINYFGSHFPETTIHLLLRTRNTFNKESQIKNSKVYIHTYTKETPFIRSPFLFTVYVIWICLITKPEAILGFLSPFALPVILAKILFFWRKTIVIVNEDNYTSGIINEYRYKLLNQLGLYLLYPLANKIIVPTMAVKHDLIDTYHIPTTKLQVIPNWTSLTKKNEENFPKTCDLIYAGRLEKTKRVHIIIQAIKQLKLIYPQILFRIYGEGREKNNLINMVNRNGLINNVKFFHPVKNIKSILLHAKIFIFSSQPKAEGFPVTMLEAMALEIPVITSDFAGADEIIKHNKNGYIYRNEQECVRYCHLILSRVNSSKRIINMAKSTIAKNCSVENIQKYIYLLNLPEISR
jgi:glycosyltransferase involved in cell wall biosynthesis